MESPIMARDTLVDVVGEGLPDEVVHDAPITASAPPTTNDRLVRPTASFAEAPTPLMSEDDPTTATVVDARRPARSPTASPAGGAERRHEGAKY
jgi:hypothetical protein